MMNAAGYLPYPQASNPSWFPIHVGATEDDYTGGTRAVTAAVATEGFWSPAVSICGTAVYNVGALARVRRCPLFRIPS